MGVFSRMATLVKAKIGALLDRVEDPVEQLDFSYEKQQELVRNVKRGLIEVVASKRRLEYQAGKVREKVPHLEEQARRSLEAGREDLAVIALQRKQAALLELQALATQITDLEAEEQRLTVASQRLQAKVEIFRGQKEMMKARYTAAEAQARIGEAFSGVSEEMADLGMITDRVEQKTQQLQARARAIDDLAEKGVLDDVGTSLDSVDRELAQLTAGQNVEAELAALRGQLRAGQQRPQLASGVLVVRIMEEGQFQLGPAHRSRLNELDNAVVTAVGRGDAAQFREAFGLLLQFVRAQGTRLPEDELRSSDILIPSPNTTFEEARDLFQGEGVVPG